LNAKREWGVGLGERKDQRDRSLGFGINSDHMDGRRKLCKCGISRLFGDTRGVGLGGGVRRRTTWTGDDLAGLVVCACFAFAFCVFVALLCMMHAADVQYGAKLSSVRCQ
jgi:hypothetical protein